MNLNSRIFVAGHNGMVGSAIVRLLTNKGYSNLILRSHKELDLTRQDKVESFFKEEKPEYVFLAAAKVGGIMANNTYRAQFIYENLMIQNNVIHAAYQNNVEKLLFLGSSCIYPANAFQPIREEYLLTGELEKTNEPYAIAKIAGIKMCENYYRQYGCDFISVMPTNLFGPNDNYDLEKSHVLPAIIRKMHLAKCLENNNWYGLRSDLEKLPIEGVSGLSTEDEIINVLNKYGITFPEISISLWGTGKVYREFLHVDEIADASLHLMKTLSADMLYNELKQTHVNIGSGIDLTIRELVETVKTVVGYGGEIIWNINKPDGTFKKQLDIQLLKDLGWISKLQLKTGIEMVYRQYQDISD